VIDDTWLNATDMGGAFKQLAEYLMLVGKNGNSDKFSFWEDTVDWAGIRITKDKAQPFPDHVKAIKDFPTPINLTDMHSYWALVNQVSPYYCVQLFRELLQKKTPWYWDAVRTDLLKMGVSYFMSRSIAPAWR
jgi:hypothetical protein